jgi:hypothetical protein
MDHCRRCGVTHATGACPGCLEETRAHLDEITRMTATLPAEVEVRGIDGEAFNLLGPAADPEARQHWEASVLAGRIVPPECDAHELADVRRWLETADDERHPLLVLGTWAMVYRDALGHPEPSRRVTVASEAGYLDRHLSEIGGFEWVPFDDFARDLARCVAHMERVLHDGEQVEKGAPCPECHRPLMLRFGGRIVDDRWVCTNTHCDVDTYTRGQYRGWVEDDALTQADRLTATDMERRFLDDDGKPTVKAGEVRVWGSRSLIRKRGRSDDGITLYDVADVQARVDARLAEADCA